MGSLGLDTVFGIEGGNLLADAILALLQIHLWLLVLLRLDNTRAVLGGGRGVGTDGIVGGLVGGLDVVGSQPGCDVLAELALVAFLAFLLELAHVAGDVPTKDAVAEDVGVKGGGLLVVSGEALLGVGDVEPTVDGALHGREHLGTGRGATETDIKERLERMGTILLIELRGVELELVQDTTGTEESGAVGSRIVGQACLDSVAGQLVGVGRGEQDIPLNLCIDDLADDVGVGDADDESVLWVLYLFLSWMIRRLRA